MKNSIRLRLAALLMAAVATTFFITGCSCSCNAPELTAEDPFATISVTEASDSIAGTAIATQESDRSMLFSEWYDAQESDTTPSAGNMAETSETPETILGNLFAIYANASTESPSTESPNPVSPTYIMSGRTQVPVSADNTISADDARNLRLEATGERINVLPADKYAKLAETLKEFTKLEDDSHTTQAVSLAARKAAYATPSTPSTPSTPNEVDSDSTAPSATSTAPSAHTAYVYTEGTPIFFNNYKTSLLYHNGVAIAELFDLFPQYCDVTTTDNSYTFKIYTASGSRTITFTQTTIGMYDVSLGDSENTTMFVTQIDTTSDTLIISTKTLEEVFGYQAEFYEGTLNIVTDCKDLFSELTTITELQYNALVNGVAPTENETAPDGPSIEEIVTPVEPTAPTAETPTSTSSEPSSPIMEAEEDDPAPSEILNVDTPEVSPMSATMYCIGNGVNIRESYSTSSNALGKFKYAAEVTVTGNIVANGYVWYQIDYSGKTAYVVSDYFSSTKPEVDVTGIAYDTPTYNPSTGEVSKPTTSSSSGAISASNPGTFTFTPSDGEKQELTIDSKGNLHCDDGPLGGIWKFENNKLYYYDEFDCYWDEITLAVGYARPIETDYDASKVIYEPGHHTGY